MHNSHAVTDRRRNKLLAVLLSVGLALGVLTVVPPEQAAAATCPCSIFSASATPSVLSDSDTDAVELGVKFRADQDGFISGVRFYKGSANTGTHTGSLWTTSGTRLANVTFTNETASGWQQANFASPVAVTANTTYIASYYAPVGRYSVNVNYFASTGVTNAPLTALQNGVDGGNGVYRYGTGGGFPSSTFNSSNYWVDVVFNTSAADTTKPTLTNQQPASGAANVSVNSTVTATFSEAVQSSTIQFTLSNGSTNVPATTSYSAGTLTATLTPSAALATSTVYTVNVSGARDSANNQMDPVSWTFTTASTASPCPCSVWAASATPATASTNDSSAVELGVKFRASQAGYVTALRFYKGSGNTGTHVGSIWSATGTKLGSVTFTGESATGWQQATLATPVPVAANTTYVASYYAPVGRYSSNANYFNNSATTNGPLTALRNGTDGGNGVYKYGATGFPSSTFQSTNYWVDVVFNTTANDTTAPVIVAQNPAPNANGVAAGTSVAATFSETIVGSSVSIELRDPSNALVAGNTAYDSGTQTATFTPSAALDSSKTYSVRVSGARDAANNTMTPVTWTFTTAAPPPPPPDQGPGGPIALVTSSANPYSKYLAEVLRTEGLNEFATIDVGTVSATTLAAYDVVVLGSVTLTSGQVSDLTAWVNGGGNLVAMRPGASLAGLLGITSAGTTISNGYLKVDNATAPGAGIVSDTIQFHGVADRYTLSGAQAIASLYTNATTATTSPAVTLNNVGSSGGQAAAFTFDLPQSIVWSRQGNPAWAGTERDGQAPIRSDDMFYGGSATDWVNLSKAAIPQADEQQRLLANVIQVMNRDKKPLPRFWYFPRGLKAVLVGTGDDHGNNGTAGRFDQYVANSPSNCSNTDWTCLRFSSYVYPGTPLSNSAAVGYQGQGFEVGIHPSTNCSNYTAASIADVYTTQLATWKTNYPGLTSPVTNRLHCIVFSDWSSQPKTELANGIRMDTNYYYWPGTWVQNRPGFMTGSGMPMRFADTDGSMIDIYQAATQMTDESGQTYPFTSNTLLDNALGPNGFYGAFVGNMHTDQATTADSDGFLSSALSRGVPIVSAKQLSDWTDGRNGSSYSNISWSANTLAFTVKVGTGANGLTGMIPTAGPNGTQLSGLTKSGSAVSYSLVTIKGVEYASFTATAGSYSAAYGASSAALTAADTAATSSQRLASTAPSSTDGQVATIEWKTSRVSNGQLMLGTSPTNLKVVKSDGGASRRHRVDVSGLKPSTTYYYRVVSTDTRGKKVTSPDVGAAPRTFTTKAADTTAPTASSLKVTALPDGAAVVRWTTDEPSLSVVSVARGSGKLTERARSTTLTKTHSVVVTGFDAGRTYSVAVTAVDGAGNSRDSKAKRFVTPAEGVAQEMAPSFVLGAQTGDVKVDRASTGSVTLKGATSGARSGTLTSSLLDAAAMADWDRAVWDADLPSGTTMTVKVRTGSTKKPDSSWSSWKTVGSSGRLKHSGRYLQYSVTLSAPAGKAAPTLYGIGFSNNAKRTVEGETR